MRKAMALSILKNPFVLSSVGGVLWKLLHLPMPTMGVQVLDMIGKGALGLALLAVGAGLRIDEALSTKGPVVLATFLKLLVMPVFMAVMALGSGRFGRSSGGCHSLRGGSYGFRAPMCWPSKWGAMPP